MKIGRDLPLVASVLKRDGSRCVACGFDLNCAITVHHAIPRAYGGVDSESNLTALCANCHKVVHWLSIGKRLDGREGQEAKRSLSPGAYLKIRLFVDLSAAI
jgi:5-methylcytosine-specific restriction endonuclease McrA